MSFDNSTLPDAPTIEVNKFALDILLEDAMAAASATIQISLISLSFGVLTVLDLACLYVLISRRSVAQTNGKILILSIILLYASTTMYVAAFIWGLSEGNRLSSKAVDGIFSTSYPGVNDAASTAFTHPLHEQSSMMTLSLAGNLMIGDAIVWWRACVIWQHKTVNFTGFLLLTLTTTRSQGSQAASLAFLLQDSFGQASGFISLCTNILATSLIGYKAWEHRQLMKRHFAAGKVSSRVLKTLALLVESGCVYSVIFIIAIIYYLEFQTRAQGGTVFRTVTSDFTVGCFVPFVAIYPTIIIVLVALKRSPIDTAGLSQIRQAQGGRASGTAEGGMSNTVVFHHSTFPSSTSVGTEGAMGGTPEGDPASEDPLETSMNKVIKDLRNLA